jgi:hypothetical protein
LILNAIKLNIIIAVIRPIIKPPPYSYNYHFTGSRFSFLYGNYKIQCSTILPVSATRKRIAAATLSKLKYPLVEQGK